VSGFYKISTYLFIGLFFLAHQLSAVGKASEHKWQANDPVSNQLDSLLDIYKTHIGQNPLKAKESVKELIAISTRADRQFYKARGHYFLAYIYNAEGKSQEAIVEGKQAAESLKKAGLENKLSAVYNLIAIAYRASGNQVQAMNYYLKCLDIAQQEDDQAEIGNVYGNIANIYIEQQQYERAIDNLQRASVAYKAANDPDGIISTLFALANIFKLQGLNEEARAKYHQVIEYSGVTNNLTQEANARINLGQILLAEQKYTEALPVLEETYQLVKKLGFTQDQLIVLNDLGVACKNLNQTSRAITYFNEALQIASSHQLHDKIHLNLSDLYYRNLQFRQAYNHLNIAHAIKDSLNSLERDKHLADLQEQYETRLKEAEIEVLEKEKSLQQAELLSSQLEVQKQTNLRNAFIIGFSIVLVLLVLLRFSYLQRIRVQKQLSTQKEENARQHINTLIKDYRLSTIKKYNEGQQQERKRIAREIHDGLGSDLASLKMSFEHYISKQLPDRGLQKMLFTIQRLYQDLRGISHQLHPPAFAERGFCDFLEHFISEKNKSTTLQLKVIFFPRKDIDQLSDSLLAEIYRITQELVTNMSKHAQASQGEIQITRHEGYVNLVVSDNGLGMSKKDHEGIGIRNIKERLEYLEGELDIDTSKRGTTFNINIPLAKQKISV